MKKLFRLLLYAMLVLASVSMSGQETIFDSSQKYPPYESLIYKLSDNHKDIARDYLYAGYLSGVEVCVDIQRMINSQQDPILNGDIENLKGIVEYYKNNSNDALEYYLKALDYFNIAGYSGGINSIMNNIALIFNHIEDYKSTRKYLVKAIEYTPEEDINSRSLYLLNLAETESKLMNCHVGVRIANDLLDIYDPEIIDFSELWIYGVLISCYTNMDRMEEANEWIEKGIDIDDDNVTYFDKVAFYSQAVNYHFQKGEFEKVIEQGLKIYPPIDTSLIRDMDEPINQMAIAAAEIGDIDLAIELNRVADRIEYGKETLDREDLITPIMVEYTSIRDNANRELAEARLSENNKRERAQRYLLVSLLIIMTAMVVLIPVLARIRKLRRKYKIELAEQNSKLEKINHQLEANNRELEKGNNLLDTFISVFAHDLINPFQAIIGFSQLMTTDHDAMKDEDFIEYADLLSDTSFQLNQLLTNLKSLSISNDDVENLKSSRVDIGEIVAGVLKLFDPTARKKNIKFKVLNSGKNCLGYINKDIIESAIRNVVSNAVKFSDNDSIIEINCIDSKDEVEVSIKDFGTGIKDEILQKLNEKKHTESMTGTASEKGSGIGLAISIELLESFNGKLIIDSRVGEGTEVKIRIPAWNE